MEQKTVLITGALGRLGSAFARSIVALEGRVFLIDLDEVKCRQFVDELEPSRADYLVADITNVDGIQKSIQ